MIFILKVQFLKKKKVVEKQYDLGELFLDEKGMWTTSVHSVTLALTPRSCHRLSRFTREIKKQLCLCIIFTHDRCYSFNQTKWLNAKPWQHTAINLQTLDISAVFDWIIIIWGHGRFSFDSQQMILQSFMSLYRPFSRHLILKFTLFTLKLSLSCREVLRKYFTK